MDSASDIESTTLFVEYDTDFIPTTTAEPELATYPINLPGYGDDDEEDNLLPGYGEDGGDENLSGYGEDSTEAANLGDDDNLPKYEEDDDQSNQIEAQLLPNYSESDNSLANYNENSQEAAAPDAYLPPEGNRYPTLPPELCNCTKKNLFNKNNEKENLSIIVVGTVEIS